MTRWQGAWLCLFVVLLIFPVRVLAAPLALSVIEKRQIDFGVVEIPPSGSEYIELSPNTGKGSPSGTGTIITGPTSRGKYRIKRTGKNPPPTISLDIQNIVTGSPHLTLDNFNGIYDGIAVPFFPQGGLPVPNKRKTLFLGARATYTSAMAGGTVLTPSYDIVVLFE